MSAPASASANTTTVGRQPGSKLRPTVDSSHQRLYDDIRRIWTGAYLRRGTTAIYIVDAKSGKELYAVHSDVGMNPASNVKLVATATALDVLGASFRYQTSVYGPTPDLHGVVKGDLYLHGDHDGSFTARDVEGLARRIAARGISRVEGDIFVGPGVRDAIAWPWTFVTIEGGANRSQPPKVTLYPKSDFVKVIVKAKTSWGRGAWAYLSRPRVFHHADGRAQVEIIVGGTIRVRRRHKLKRWIPMRSLFTASVLRSALIASGVAVTGHAKQMLFEHYVRSAVIEHDFLPIELATHHSRPLSQLIAKINKQSDNMAADLLAMTIGRRVFGGAADLQNGARAMTMWLSKYADVTRSPVVLDTGSGLSYRTKLSARQIVRTLRVAGGYDLSTPVSHTKLFRDSLAIAGVDGTLRRRFLRTSVRGNLHGKTGTLSTVVALSGFLHGPHDRVLAFSIVTNGTRRHLRRRVRNRHDAITLAMRRYLLRGQAPVPK